jgi:SIR2-like domain
MHFYANPYSWANLVQMSLLLSQSCLFVGVSLTDPNIRRLLDACVALPIAHKHYAIMRSPVVGLTGDARQAGEDLRRAKAESW